MDGVTHGQALDQLATQTIVIANLRAQVRRMSADMDLLALCVPRDRRADALALVRDRAEIEAWAELLQEAPGAS